MNIQFENPQIIAYAGKGWAVFPIHTWANGCCTCRKTDCDVRVHSSRGSGMAGQ